MAQIDFKMLYLQFSSGLLYRAGLVPRTGMVQWAQTRCSSYGNAEHPFKRASSKTKQKSLEVSEEELQFKNI